MTIYSPWNSNFGDQWATINLLAQKSICTKEQVLLHSPMFLRAMHEEICYVLDVQARVLLVDAAPTRQLSGFDVWATPYLSTRTRWQEAASHYCVCYQFDGVSCAEDKNPSSREEALMVASLERIGFPVVRLGKHMSVMECVLNLVHSVFFVGVDSGMSHVAHSVGLPIFLLEYKLPVVTTHRGKAYIHCAGTEDFLRWKLPTWMTYQRFIGHPDVEKSTYPVGNENPKWRTP